MTARYTFDFADRQSTLALEGAGSASGPLVTAASYLPSGPVARLELGNGLAEVRDFDSRYFPERITVPEVFDWAYTTDAVGNVTAVTDGLDPAGSRTYGYQDVHYFLTQGNGPWGALSWSYDKIGNRLSETRDGVTATYSYSPNASGGTSPKLAAVSESEGETRRHFYDTIGDLTMVAGDTAKTRYTYDDAKRLSQIARDAADEPPALTDLRYDGRGFLRRAELRRFPDRAAGPPSVETTATYSSEGLLHHRGHVERPDAASPRGTPVTADDVMVVYFAGRPVAHVGVGARARSSPISPPTIWARRCW
jgi:YD repeat-containing protein